MKHIFAALLSFSGFFAMADEPLKQFVQFNESDAVTQAFKYLKHAKPKLDVQKCEFDRALFSCGHKTADATLTVVFKLLGSELKVIEDGRSHIRHRLLVVTFPSAASPEAAVTESTSNQYGDFKR